MAVADLLLALGGILAGGGAAGGVAVKMLNRNVDASTVAKTKAETAQTEVNTIREVLNEVRLNDAAKTEQLADVSRRLYALEERERHSLTRAAVHEAWDQLALQFILSHTQTFPSPPPLLGPLGLDEDDTTGETE